MRIRDLKVWFPLRHGLLREFVGGEPTWVRAVDGASFDIRRGEVFCLVGESGCGKTTTGKAILKLVESTEGDIFVDMPDAEFRNYEAATRDATGPATARRLDELRRKHSITWKETQAWTYAQFATLIAMVETAFLAALLIPGALVGLLTDPFVDPTKTLGIAIGVGFALGFIGSLPPARPWNRTPIVLTAAAFLAIIGVSLPAFFFHALVTSTLYDPSVALGAPWQEDLFGMLFATAFGPIVAGGVSAFWIDSRKRREGMTGIRIRGLRRRLQLIFQDPYESLNPKQSVYEIVAEPLLVNKIVTNPEEVSDLVVRTLEDVGLRPASEFVFRFPHELSGGQRQRVSIAAALVLQPDFIVADEPVSMLDVSIRTEILQLMLDLRRSRGLTYLFITHDLSLAWVLADRIGVMYLGKIVELGSTEQVIARPKHPYTQALISVVPSPDPRHKVERIILRGERPDPVAIPPGCRFHPRCPLAFERCGWSAAEVSEELRSAQAAGLLPGIASIEPLETGTVDIGLMPGASVEAAALTLRSLTEANRDSRLALKGIADIRPSGATVRVTLHEGSEPQLVEVEPGNVVACHLVTAPIETPQAVTA
ncbi:MAG TPA: oligopeptide/dipeptide ABC transporter ATP-binding protein [Thermoplasmata archaeon]